MAYNNSRNSQNSNSFSTGSSSSGTAMGKPVNAQGEKRMRDVLFSTGLFAPDREGVKAVGTIQVLEDVTIPAGSYINLYDNSDAGPTKSGGRAPAYKILVTPGVLKKRA